MAAALEAIGHGLGNEAAELSVDMPVAVAVLLAPVEAERVNWV